MTERTIQAVPAHDDEVVLKHCYPIRVQNSIIQNAISCNGLKLTATGRLNQASVERILEDIEPIICLGREIEKPYRRRESDVHKLEDMRTQLIALGVVKPENGKLYVQDGAEIKPSHLFNKYLLPQVDAVLSEAMPMFTRLKFKPFVDYMSAIAEGQEVSAALNSVSKHERTTTQQQSAHKSVIYPNILMPFIQIGLLVNSPVRPTNLWSEVIRIS